jgi:hypothetical protein
VASPGPDFIRSEKTLWADDLKAVNRIIITINRGVILFIILDCSVFINKQ